ncbi:ATP-binding protein [Micromonosporaceae bacterium Da 78-11]
MRDRTRIESRTRRPNGPPQAAGGDAGPTRRRLPPVLDQLFDGGGLVALRSAVSAYAAELGADDRQVDDIVLLAHELASNVVRHGGGEGRLRLWRDGGEIVCRVSDSGPGLTEAGTKGVELPSPRVFGGRGLWIVRRLATVRIDTGPDGTTITAAVQID